MNDSYVNKILQESASTSTDKADLLAIHQRAIDKVYDSIVSVQPTKKPEATVYGAKFFYEDGDNGIEVIKGASYGGSHTYQETQDLNDYDDTNPYAQGDIFKVNGFAIEVLSDTYDGEPIATVEDGKALVFEGIVNNQLRIITDGAGATAYDNPNRDIQEAWFKLSRWNSEVKTRKFKTQYTIELLQDLESSQLEAEVLIQDLFSTVVSEEINIDVISKLNVVAKRDTAVDVSGLNSEEAARTLLTEISKAGANITKESTYKPTFVVASPDVVGLLQSLTGVKSEKTENGQAKYFIESSGIEIIVDRYALGNYFTVGAKNEGEGFDLIAPLYFAPYNVNEGGMNHFAMGNDPKSLQPILVGTTRYALCTSPYANETDGKKANVIDGENWAELAGKCELARFRQVIL